MERNMVQDSLGQKVSETLLPTPPNPRFSTNKTGVVTQAFDTSYVGGIGRRLMVPGQLWAEV
jgi:hypothetical protein